MKLTFDTSDFEDGLRELEQAKDQAAQGAAFEFLLRIKDLSQTMVPVRTGHLKGNWRVSVPDVGASKVEGAVEYLADYAAAVHESTEKSYNRGQAKFLEQALDQLAGEANAFLTDRFVERLSAGGGGKVSEEKGPTA